MSKTVIWRIERNIIERPDLVFNEVPDYVAKQFLHLENSNGGLGLRGSKANVVKSSINRANDAYRKATVMTGAPPLGSIETPTIVRQKMRIRLDLSTVI